MISKEKGCFCGVWCVWLRESRADTARKTWDWPPRWSEYPPGLGPHVLKKFQDCFGFQFPQVCITPS